jgi:quercetin dioxygenase-like cupin family protein
MTAEFILNHLEARTGEPSPAGGDVYVTLASGSQTSDGYFLTHAIVPPGGGPPAHTHTREEEAFYVIRGELTFLAGDDEVTAGPGTFVNVPRGMKHRFHNDSDAEAEMIFWFAPADIEGLFRELGESPDRLVEIGERYGTTYHFDE